MHEDDLGDNLAFGGRPCGVPLSSRSGEAPSTIPQPTVSAQHRVGTDLREASQLWDADQGRAVSRPHAHENLTQNRRHGVSDPLASVASLPALVLRGSLTPCCHCLCRRWYRAARVRRKATR